MTQAPVSTRPARADERAPTIGAVHVSLPAHRYDQAELTGALARRWPKVARRIGQFASSLSVASRHLALPLEAYDDLGGFGAANDAFIRVGTTLAADALKRALAQAGLAPSDVDAIFFTTVTGLAAPTIDARLVNTVGLRKDVRRIPMFGLGCVGGAAGIARATDYLRGRPDDVAVLVAVELCSLTLQDELSVPNLIASGLFGDGAAAVVLGGAARTYETASIRGRPRVLDTRSVFFSDTERVMGWDIGARGFSLVLSADVPNIARAHLPPEVDAFLGKHALSRKDIAHWVCHPGGPKVIRAIEEGLGLSDTALDPTRQSLAEIGNLSSASVLHVLASTPARRGDLGVLLAMGPGFCAELVLLRW